MSEYELTDEDKTDLEYHYLLIRSFPPPKSRIIPTHKCVIKYIKLDKKLKLRKEYSNSYCEICYKSGKR